MRATYGHLPYLNSSLYEPSELERRTTVVKGLDDRLTLPLYRKSVLPAQKAAPHTLAYLLRFLDAYNFASEGDEQVQGTHKPHLPRPLPSRPCSRPAPKRPPRPTLATRSLSSVSKAAPGSARCSVR